MKYFSRNFFHPILFGIVFCCSSASYGQLNIQLTSDLTTPFLNKSKLGLKGCVKSVHQKWLSDSNGVLAIKYEFDRYGAITDVITVDESFEIYQLMGELMGYSSFFGEQRRLTKSITETSIEKKDSLNRPTLLLSQTRQRDATIMIKGAGTKIMQVTYRGDQAIERKILEKNDGVETYRIWTEIFIKNDVDEEEATKISQINLVGSAKIPSYVGMSVYSPSGLVVEKNEASTKIYTYKDGLLQKQTILSSRGPAVHLSYTDYKSDSEGNWLTRGVTSDEAYGEKLVKESRVIEYQTRCR